MSETEKTMENEFSSTEPVYKNFILYRTEPLYSQPRGWVIFSMTQISADACPKIPGTAWVEAPPGKYNFGDIIDPENP
ncbi:hypothetical protein [Bombella apis]|uniref:hypothetical protein n=1 Tax=Bombella apis TaxID=1785988 RepID=UPI0024A876C4|nr:hypothetical protein [Bombella apis]